MDDVTIYHNPNCSTSCQVLAELKDQGYAPRIVEYMKSGWSRERLVSLLEVMDALPRDILRTKEPEARQLLAAGADDETILQAMITDPVLVERPIVQTARGAVIARPPERAQQVLR